jgi:hypothetical protein
MPGPPWTQLEGGALKLTEAPGTFWLVRSSVRSGLALLGLAIVFASIDGGVAAATNAATKTKATNLSSMPVQSGYKGNENFCATQPFGGTITYRVSSGRATIGVALHRLPKRALIGIEWSNNTVRGYLVGTVRTDSRGDSIPGSEKLFRTGESRGYRIVLTSTVDDHALGNLWPCGPPRISPPAVAIDPAVTVSPDSGLTDGATVKVTVSGFGIGEKIFLSECASAVDANDLGCGPQLALQPFVVTGTGRSGSVNFDTSERAASVPYTSTLSTFCAEFCVLVATQGDGFAWAVAPLGFGSSPGGLSGGESTTVTSATTSPPCANDQVAVTDSGGGAGLGHEDQILVFTNTSTTTCTLRGYPGVAGLNASGQEQVEAARTPDGYMGGLAPGTTTLPFVSLAPGRVASAVAEGTDNPLGSQPCPYYPFLLVTPPNLTEQIRVEVSGLGTEPTGLPGCTTIEVHPVVAGITGSG